MNPRDYEDLLRTLAPDTPHQSRVRKADRLLQQLGYVQIGQYDIARRMQGVPATTLHGIVFIRPHYHAVITAMCNVLRAYKDQKDVTPLPNLEHLRLAEFIYHAPRVWWRGLDQYRGHIMTCAQAASEPDMDRVFAQPVRGASSTFAQVSGIRMTPQQPFAARNTPQSANVTMHASPMVARNTVYQVHNPNLPSAISPASSSPPTTPYAQAWAMPDLASVTSKPYETPLFTWLLEFTRSIRSLSLNSAAVV